MKRTNNMSDINPSTEELREKIEKLEDLIKHEDAMYETALAYPTETSQFYDALERTRQKINGMRTELAQLKETRTILINSKEKK